MRKLLIASAFLVVSCGGTEAPREATALVDSGATDTTPVACAERNVNVALASEDPYAYPPYAIDGCSVAYVASDGALHLRDLASGRDEVIDAAPARRPTLAGETLAWETGTKVRVRHAGGAIITIDGAGEPRAARDAVVFTRFLGDEDTDVQLLIPSTGRTTTVAGGPGQQRFADINDGFVALTDFAEDPDGRFDNNESDLADILIFDRATSTLTPRKRLGKQAFPILAGGKSLVYLDWQGIHPQPKLEAYELWSTRVDAAPSSDLKLAAVGTMPPHVRPAGRGGIVEWVAREPSGISLFRVAVDTGRAPAKVPLEAIDLYAPATSGERTAIGVTTAGAAVASLRVLAR